jgi:crotonobetainyl-CoA:carnitine CoA-transferase CaiB-like acyl-CoA transferase
VDGAGTAAAAARRLLADVGLLDPGAGDAMTCPAATPLQAWAASGAMALTGRPDGPPLAAPGDPAGATAAGLAVLARCTALRAGAAPELPDAGVLAERGAVAGLHRSGPWSAGGAMRCLPARDGWLALSLARPEDVELVPALVEDADPGEAWGAVARWLGGRGAAEAAERAQWLGLPAAAVPDRPGVLDDAHAAHRGGVVPVLRRDGGPRRPLRERPLVVDLTALWAGPLCAHLLGLAGADVVKVESVHRPDGARRGPAAFYDLLHAGHRSVALDLTAADGRRELGALLARADVVLEASRPRAMAQLGVDPARLVADGAIWTSITAYGRSGPWAGRVGFGDDVAAAAGLVVRDAGEPLPCGDALADPLTGAWAAAATAAALLGDRGCLLDVSMRDVVAAAGAGPAEPHTVHPTLRGWEVVAADGRRPVAEPRRREPAGRAAPLGADTDAVLRELGVR